jgi:hypothetical protein
MTGNLGAPEGGRTPDAPRPAVQEQAERPRSGRVTELALVAAGLGLVAYLLGFVDDAGLGVVVGPLLVGGGLLAGSVVLPSVSTRMLVPAAVGTVTGALFLLQTVVGGADSPFAIGALVLALLEAGAVTGAALMQAGVVRAPRPKPVAAAPHPGGYQPGLPGQPGQQYAGQPYPGQPYPGQPYPGQPYPGSYAPPPGGGYPDAAPPAAAPQSEQYLGDQYAGEHAYAQNARYGAQYGVPGYPPPPPYGAPVHDPAGNEPAGTGGWPARRRAEAPADGGSAEPPLFGADPTSTDDAGAGTTAVVQTSGVHRARPPRSDSAATEGRDEPTTVVYASGAHRARAPQAEPVSGPTESRSDPATAVQASGAHRAQQLFRPDEPRSAEPAPEASSTEAPASTGGKASGSEGADGGHDAEAAEAMTRAIPRVTDER